jgi:hypothetical protein
MCNPKEHELLTYEQKQVKIDKCLVPQIKELWEGGIRTYGCCCGHQGDPPYPMPKIGFISIHYDDLEKAIALGFEQSPMKRQDPTAPCWALKPKETRND